jgi:6-phosphogluconolactonase (cycloisomerase 2 family)
MLALRKRGGTKMPILSSSRAFLLSPLALVASLASCKEDRAVPPSNPVPTLTSIAPSALGAGGPATTLTATGSSFIQGSVVRIQGFARRTTFVSPTELSAALYASDLAAPGTFEVTVLNPGPGGGLSEPQTLTVSAPAPGVTGIAPSSARAGSPGFILTVTGTGFLPVSTVRWNDASRPTSYRSPTELRASISAADLVSAGTAQVTVFSPGPGGGLSGAAAFEIQSPVPSITAVSPTSATAGASEIQLSVTGTGFVPGSVVRWNGADRGTTYVNPTLLQASISAVDIAAPGTVALTVFNPPPGGGASGPVSFAVNSPRPVASSLSPSSALVGASAFTLTVNGSGFVTGSVVRWNGEDRATTRVSGTELRAAILASDVAVAGTAQIAVFNPAPGGGTSTALTFSVNNPQPALTVLEPASALVGGAGFLLTARGTGFLPTSVGRWNGSSRATTYRSATELQMAVLGTDLSSAGAVQVTVANPAPGGGASAAQVFTVENPAPTLVTRSPESVLAGSADLVLTLTGTGFVPGSVVRWNGSDRATTFVSATELRATIPAGDLATASLAQLTVFSPAPGGGASSPLDFSVNNPVPTLASITPTSATAGGSTPLSLEVVGSHFVPTSVVLWNGQARPTTFSSATRLLATIPTSDLASAGETPQVRVFNPGPGGGTSRAKVFTVGPVPRVAVVSNYGDGTISSFLVNNDTGQLYPRSYLELGADVGGVAIALDRYALVTSRGGGSPNPGYLQVVRITEDGRLEERTSWYIGNNVTPQAVATTGRFVYVTAIETDGVYGFVLDPDTGGLAPINFGAIYPTGADPFAAITDPQGRFLYTANYAVPANNPNVSVFWIDASTGALTARTPVTAGSGAVGLAVDPAGKFLYVANYLSSNVSVFSINQSTGALSKVADSPTGANPISLQVDPAGRFLYVARLVTPSTNPSRVEVYQIGGDGRLTPTGTVVDAGALTYSFVLDASGRYGYAVNGGGDIFVYGVDRSTGALVAAGGRVRARFLPLFMALTKGSAAIRPEARLLLAGNEGSGDLMPFLVDTENGGLTSPGPGTEVGAAPTALAVDPTSRFAYLASAGGASITAYRIDSATGALLELAAPITGQSQPSSVALDPSGRFLYLTLADSNLVRRFVVSLYDGRIETFSGPGYPEPLSYGTGPAPAAVVVEPTGRFAYVANQGGNSVSAFRIDESTGSLSAVSGSPFAAGSEPTALAAHPSGQYLYVANRGADTISVHAVTSLTGELVARSTVPTGARPVALVVDFSGKFLRVACQKENTVRVYSIDPDSGALTAAGTFSAGTAPVALSVDPTGRFAYALNRISQDVTAYGIDPATGALSVLEGSPFGAGTFPAFLGMVLGLSQ